MALRLSLSFDGRFRLGDVLGSGSYAVVYHARNIIRGDMVAVKLEPIVNRTSSIQNEYHTLRHLEGGVGIPHAIWFGRESTYHALVLDLLGPSLHALFLSHNRKFTLHAVMNLADQLLSRLEYIHSHNYVHGDIKPQNVAVGLNDLRHTAFIIDFGLAKEYCDMSTRLHHGRCDDLESLTYMLIYFLRGSLPWLTDDQEKLSSSSMLKHKANTTIEALCRGIPNEFATMLIYTCSLAFSEDPDYNHLRSLLHGICATFSLPTTCSLDFSEVKAVQCR
ncbi:kinase-like domain-containing protein [Suillus subluteus]|nr:kinase-like domain-containing protein [Suillus subluteus]